MRSHAGNDDLAQRLLARLRRDHPDIGIDTSASDADTLHLTINDTRIQLALDNLRRAVDAAVDAAEADAAIDGFAAAFADAAGQMSAEQAGTRPLDADTLLPTVRTRAYLEQAFASIAASGDDAKGPVFATLNEELAVMLYADLRTSIRMINHGDLEDLGLSEEEAFNRAMENLGPRLAELGAEFTEGVMVMSCEPELQPALMLLDGLWDATGEHLAGDPVVGLPCRDLLLAAGSDDPAGLAKLREIVAGVAADAERPMTTTLFVLRDQTWQPLPDDA